jgi:hypothetical protein
MTMKGVRLCFKLLYICSSGGSADSTNLKEATLRL